MKIIDAHHHFWKLGSGHHPWLEGDHDIPFRYGDYSALKRDYLVEDFRRDHGRPNLGLLAQPFSCIGLPVATVPVFSPGEMPLGMQFVARPWQEATALRAAAQLELFRRAAVNGFLADLQH